MSQYFKEDLSGKRFGELKVISFVKNDSRRSDWLCECSCGRKTIVYAGHLKNGHTTTCGAQEHRINKRPCSEETKVAIGKANTKHGGSKDRLYRVWASMINRCENPNEYAYRWYGGKGVRVCDSWHDYSVFKEWAMRTGYNESAKSHECSIDRVDSSGDYCPENCRWVDAKAQSNNRSNNRLYTYNGVTKNIRGWADEYGLPYRFLHQRLTKYGWSLEKALFTPSRL